jgi:hypothetical protein
MNLELQALGIVLSSIEGTFAMKAFVGGINAISGRPIPTAARLLRNVVSTSINMDEHDQDYIVLPNQSRLDGITIIPGCVSQFVSTKMKPVELAKKGLDPMKKRVAVETNTDNLLGSSIEHQVINEDNIGGIQLEIIPALDPTTMFFSKQSRMRSYFPTGWPVINEFDRHDVEENKHLGTHRLDPMKTPAELGFKPGDCFYMKDLQQLQPCRPKRFLTLSENSLHATRPKTSE